MPLVFRLEKTQNNIYLITNTKKYKTMNTEITNKKAEKQAAVSSGVFLQIGMKVKIKNQVKEYLFDAGKEKTITSDLPNFGKSRAFGLDGDDGIWCIEDFEYCINYPKLSMR